jgi:hypothetical protein
MMQLSLRLRLLLAAVGLFVVGLAVGWQTAVDGPDASGLKPLRDDWSEPAAHAGDTAKLVKDLDQHSLWGESAPAAAAGPTAEEKAAAEAKAAAEWRLSGIVDQNGKAWAVIMTPGVGKAPPHVQNSKIGDQLPDGSKIVAIAKTTITVADATGQKQVKMFLSK